MTDWTSSKVMHLIRLFEEHQQDFCSNVIKKKDTWQKLANLLNVNGGQQFTSDEVDKKWRGLRERYLLSWLYIHYTSDLNKTRGQADHPTLAKKNNKPFYGTYRPFKSSSAILPWTSSCSRTLNNNINTLIQPSYRYGTVGFNISINTLQAISHPITCLVQKGFPNLFLDLYYYQNKTTIRAKLNLIKLKPGLGASYIKQTGNVLGYSSWGPHGYVHVYSPQR